MELVPLLNSGDPMPLYEYQCSACRHRFEVLQRLGEDGGDLTCPSCGQPRPEKQFSTFASSVAGSSSAEASSACCGKPFT
jgi:putative FmdB family regulatory protein